MLMVGATILPLSLSLFLIPPWEESPVVHSGGVDPFVSSSPPRERARASSREARVADTGRARDETREKDER